MKKILSLILVIALVAGIAVTGTMAYLTDRDNEANVFTVGDVEIELKETYEQASQLMPGVAVEKEATIKNIGGNKAWVWLTYAVPAKLDSVIKVNLGTETDWVAGEVSDATIKVDEVDVEYKVHAVLYNEILVPKATTSAGIVNVALNSKVDIDPNGNWYIVDGTATGLEANSDDYENPVIFVNAYAIQEIEGVDSVQGAYDKYIGQWGKLNGEYKTNVAVVDNKEELIEALEDEDTDEIVLGGDINMNDPNNPLADLFS